MDRRRLHILHVTPCYEPAWAFGQTPATVAALAKAQAARGHSVTVLTTDAMAPHERLPRGDLMVEGVRVVRVPNVSGSIRVWLGWSTPIGMRRRARTIFGELAIDVIHLHELVSIESVRVVCVAPERIPVVVSLHQQFDDGAVLSARLGRVWYRTGGRRVLARLRRAIAASPEAAVRFEQRWTRLAGAPFPVPLSVADTRGAGEPVAFWDRVYADARARLSSASPR